LRQAVEEVAKVLHSYQDLPIALFGHSMGAVVCFELARKLRSQHLTPVHLFVSGRRSPQYPDRRPRLTPLPNESFVAEICRRYNGIPREVLQEPELMELLLPTLRADVEMLETYDYQPGLPFEFPITAFGGLHDHETPLDELRGWKDQTSARFESNVVPGDHFFLRSAATEILAIIRRELDSAAASLLSRQDPARLE
jgi:medium-chain acyl-[acyl-carrier-protein] hydrolase